MPCLICRYFQPNEPAQHKQDREAGRCQSNCGKKWDQHTGINYVKNHGSLEGWCFRYPEAKQVKYNHVCGEVSVREYFLNHYWRVEPFQADKNLFEWAEKTLGIMLHDNGDWNAQERARLEKQNIELRRQLKRAREISASRLKRLQKVKDDKPPVSEPECSAEPFRPHLVAAE
jgi:hypothetical protein